MNDRDTLELLEEARDVILGLVDQQAMPDPWYTPTLEKLNKILNIKRCLDCGKQILKESTRCNGCTNKLRQPKFAWPPVEELVARITSGTPYTTLSKELGVSDNAIRKHMIRAGVVPPRYRTPTSQYRGVWYDKRKTGPNPWGAEIMHQGKTYHVGFFPTELKAHAALVAWRIEHELENA